MSNDLTFFTNEEGRELLERFTTTLKYVKQFDVLVGYFRASGFKLLADSLESVEKIRILVGLTLDKETFQDVELFQQLTLTTAGKSNQQTTEAFSDELVQEITATPDNAQTAENISLFLQWLIDGKIEMRVYAKEKIHAKVYISHLDTDRQLDAGRVHTGSSNFSYSGLKGNLEFNVELKNRADYEFASTKFEQLWAEGVDVSAEYVDTIRTKTWLNDEITPYQLYLKFLYEYFKAEINEDRQADGYLPNRFMKLQYQKEAVGGAHRILNEYGGVFLADVVGLGKTYISAMLAQKLDPNKGKILVICPPPLLDYWDKTMQDFRVPATIESLGKLDSLANKNLDDYGYIFIDEAHRFRNEMTQRYENLTKICRGKKIVLISATPMNNKPDDIMALLKLFQKPKKSTIPGIPNLESYFAAHRSRLNKEEKDTPEYIEALQDIAGKVRTDILQHIMVRRTRSEIVRYFTDDIEKQGLTFPNLMPPERLVYQFDDQLKDIFKETVARLTKLQYARYTPLLFLNEQLAEFEQQGQKNIETFMRILLVKRLESSFHAFKKTLGRFITSYTQFVDMAENRDTIFISKKINVYDVLAQDDEELIEQMLNNEDVKSYPVTGFTPKFFKALRDDLALLEQLAEIWKPYTNDPKLDELQTQLANNPLLTGKKLLIFTESAETGAYLHKNLHATYPDKVLFYSSAGGQRGDNTITTDPARNLIRANFEPNDQNEERDDLQILITTDVLAEGINLHRSNLIMNYDLPWNPTRVLQRVGRINRVGSKHEQLHIFNFFPSDQGNLEIGLEENITSKLQAFHDMLGEDAKYLTEEEEISQHGMFGHDLYKKVNDLDTYEAGEEEDVADLSMMKYLTLIRKIRDNDTDLFEKIKKIPAKSRAGQAQANTPHKTQVVSFFRVGNLRRFYLTYGEGQQEVEELSFQDAVSRFEATPDTPRVQMPNLYHPYLERNKQTFAESLQEKAPAVGQSGGGASNSKKLRTRIKFALKKEQSRKMTDQQEEWLKLVLKELGQGTFADNLLKRLNHGLKNVPKNDGRDLYNYLYPLIDDALLIEKEEDEEESTFKFQRKEIILSAYITQAVPTETGT